MDLIDSNFAQKGRMTVIYNCGWKLRIWPHLLKKSLMENFIFLQCEILN